MKICLHRIDIFNFLQTINSQWSNCYIFIYFYLLTGLYFAAKLERNIIITMFL